MRTFEVRGGWQAWALLIVGSMVLLVLGVLFGVLVLGLLVMATVLVLGQRILRALGLGGRRSVPPTSATRGGTYPDSVIEGEYQVLQRADRRAPDRRASGLGASDRRGQGVPWAPLGPLPHLRRGSPPEEAHRVHPDLRGWCGVAYGFFSGLCAGGRSPR
jgi:hypothetical protein